VLPRLALSCATASRSRPKTAGLSQGHSEQLQFAAWEVDNTGCLGSEDGRSVVGAGQLAEHNASLAPAAARVPGNDDIVGISRTGRPTEPGRRKGAGAHRVVPDDGRKAAPVALAEKLYQIQLIPLLGPGRRGQACVASLWTSKSRVRSDCNSGVPVDARFPFPTNDILSCCLLTSARELDRIGSSHAVSMAGVSRRPRKSFCVKLTRMMR
jgi:hypothetical protein